MIKQNELWLACLRLVQETPLLTHWSYVSLTPISSLRLKLSVLMDSYNNPRLSAFVTLNQMVTLPICSLSLGVVTMPSNNGQATVLDARASRVK